MLGRSCPDRLGEQGKRDGEDLCRHTRQQIPLGLAGGWLHKTVDVEPLEALLDGHSRARATADPDPAQDRLQPNAVLIGGPQFDRGLRVSLLQGF